MKKKITISVIIPVHNGENHINKSFEALIKQDFTEPYEIIIIDDASTDNSRELIKKYNLPNVKLYSLSSNSGQSAARNLGIRKAAGEYIYFQDMEFETDLGHHVGNFCLLYYTTKYPKIKN